MKRFLFWLLIVIPGTVVALTLAIANRHIVRLVLDPFNRADPVLYLELPFFLYVFAALIVGIFFGWWAAWRQQAKWRRAAKEYSHDAARWKREVERLARRQARDPAPDSLLPLTHRS